MAEGFADRSPLHQMHEESPMKQAQVPECLCHSNQVSTRFGVVVNNSVMLQEMVSQYYLMSAHWKRMRSLPCDLMSMGDRVFQDP